jgi:hypothetical protein
MRGLVALTVITLAGCDESTSPGNVTECTTPITSAGAFTELCALSAPVRHVRIENLTAGPTHASAQIVFGFDAPPTASSGPIAEGQFRVLFYGGGTPFPSPIVQASYGAVDATLHDNATFVHAATTVCFDVHDGSATGAPAFVLWVSGQRGADCDDDATLTAATAFAARVHWQGATGEVSKDAKAYFRQTTASTGLAVTLRSASVLDAEAIAAATTCTTTWANNTEWQQLCAPAAGAVRHVRVEGAQSTANSSYFYTILGQDANPTGSPSGSEGKLIVTGGRNHAGASWTWYRFGTGTTTQFSYATDAGAALYTAGPSTICYDIGANDDGTARFVFWATGANGADCADRSTLTLETMLYESSSDESTAGIWNGPYATGKLNFVKTSNGNVSLGNVVVSAEPAIF